MDIEQLREQLRALVDEMRGIVTPPEDVDDVERWQPTDEAAARFDELDTQATELREKIATAERRIASIEASTAVLGGDDAGDNRGRLNPPNVNRQGDPYDLDTVRFDASLGDLRARVATGLERDDVTPDEAKVAAMRTLRKVDGDKVSVARRYLATGSETYRSAFAKMAQGRQVELNDDERAALARAQSLTNGEGGFAVPFTLDPTIIGVDGGSINPFRRIARVVQTTTDSWNGVTGTAASFSYDGEAVEVSDDSVTLTQPAIPVHKLQGFVPFSVEVQGDWADIDSDLRAAMMEGRDNREALAHAKGTGSGEPTGIETALDGTASEIAPQTAETFAAADVYNLQRILPPKHRQANPRWVLNIGTANDIRQFDTAGGGDFWVSLAPGAPPALLGWDWDEASEIDDSPDINPAVNADNFVLYVGNWSRFVIVDRVGMSVELIPHLVGANRRPTGQRGLWAWMRGGANVVDVNAFRVLSIPTAV